MEKIKSRKEQLSKISEKEITDNIGFILCLSSTAAKNSQTFGGLGDEAEESNRKYIAMY